jgi:Xaa-Pro aminopeptidase
MEKEFFTRNRQTLYGLADADVIILAGNVSVQRSHDASYAFEQEANFWYLTGINAPGWWVIIKNDKSFLIAPDVDEVHRIFDGSLSDKDAVAISGVDAVLTHSAGEVLLSEMKEAGMSISSLGDDPYAGHYDFSLNPGPTQMKTTLLELFGEITDCRRILAKQRAIKTPKEIELMRASIALTVEAFEKVRSNIDTYGYEYEIEADFSYHFRRGGAVGHAYDPIVATGKNACTLHYGKNQDALIDGDLVLLDIGARLNGYAADISRTYAHGKVSERHRAVHAQVADAHHQIIALLRPGLLVKDYFEHVDAIMQTALKNLDLLKSEEDYRTYFPHSISHGLGIDVHDSLGSPETFEAGMVLTVEPGIYIPKEGIGVRIEDDILITATGNENLSASLSTDL